MAVKLIDWMIERLERMKEITKDEVFTFITGCFLVLLFLIIIGLAGGIEMGTL